MAAMSPGPRGRHEHLANASRSLLAAVIVLVGWTHGVLYVEGASMSPALSPGDIIVYRRMGVRLAQRDLVVFEHDGTLVVHRVAGLLRGGRLRTRGDANATLDPLPVDRANVRGEVVFVVPSGKAATGLARLAR